MAAPAGHKRKILSSFIFYLGVPALLAAMVYALPLTCTQTKSDFARAAPPERPPATVVERQFDTYEEAKAFVAEEKKQLRGSHGHQAAAFTRLLKNNLAPFWLGTPWDFNGITQRPGQGSIACGYFVTTLLRDMGVPLNRVALAQCASSKLITALTGNAYVKHYSNMSFDDFIAAINSKGLGVTIAGLDFHTGLLVHDGHELWFLHANYINRQGVLLEKAAASAALKASATRMCGHITADPAFIKRWAAH